ncbi:hypothetical protein [Streptomyces sp. TRM68416]|nr:hypothetical protein [Streptomyces sp. TRM68416]MBD0838710.1 hypothetical protein [Streptomyces sp. TRM68416]
MRRQGFSLEVGLGTPLGLVPLLRRSCPEGADGYGGSYQVNLDDASLITQ